jgi:hypothetical protein
MPSRESSVRNLLKAVDSPNWHRPRPWRSREEAEIVRRYAFWWFNCRDQNKPSVGFQNLGTPSGRDWARQLGISHTWLQRLVREFEADPAEMWSLQATYGDPNLAELNEAKECTEELRRQGELHPRRRRRRGGDLDE